MDQHFLTPLFAPTSIAIFAGSTDDPEQLTEQARLLHPALRAQRFTGTYRFIDIRATSGTLADLASAKSDLAIIALPFEDIAPAIELASRMDRHAVMVLGGHLCRTSGGAAQGGEAGRCAPAGPQRPGHPAPALAAQCQRGWPWRAAAAWPWCRNRAH